MGYKEYEPIASEYRVPIVVTGFEPLDLLDAIRRTVIQLESGAHEVENAYPRAVNRTGNEPARRMIGDVFRVADRKWRGIGMIPGSGWVLSDSYRSLDAAERFTVTDINTQESPLCHAGEVLRGQLKPSECPAFGKECTPRTPLGATMVSSEGACAAYYLYGRMVEAAG
jgi:hydrogenase expression/formation protein HypD